MPVVVYAAPNSCNEFDRSEVDESDDAVATLAHVARIGRHDRSADYTRRSVPVELSRPIGSRSLSGCVAPEDGLRAGDLPDDDVDCRIRVYSERG